MKNHHLAQAIADVGFHEFRRQLTYKGEWYGCEVLVADRFYPSSKRCSRCGNVKAGFDLSERVYECDSLPPDHRPRSECGLEFGALAYREFRGKTRLWRGCKTGSSAVLDEAGTEHRSTTCRLE